MHSLNCVYLNRQACGSMCFMSTSTVHHQTRNCLNCHHGYQTTTPYSCSHPLSQPYLYPRNAFFLDKCQHSKASLPYSFYFIWCHLRSFHMCFPRLRLLTMQPFLCFSFSSFLSGSGISVAILPRQSCCCWLNCLPKMGQQTSCCFHCHHRFLLFQIKMERQVPLLLTILLFRLVALRISPESPDLAPDFGWSVVKSPGNYVPLFVYYWS